MPYYTCSGCSLSYYSAASWAYAPECPRCSQPLSPPINRPGRIVSIERGTGLRKGGSPQRRRSGPAATGA